MSRRLIHSLVFGASLSLMAAQMPSMAHASISVAQQHASPVVEATPVYGILDFVIDRFLNATGKGTSGDSSGGGTTTGGNGGNGGTTTCVGTVIINSCNGGNGGSGGNTGSGGKPPG